MWLFDLLFTKDNKLTLLTKENIDLKLKVDDLNTYIINKDNELKIATTTISDLKSQLNILQNGTDLENYWNNKRLKTEKYVYGARPAILTGTNNILVDPRIFFINYDSSIPLISADSNDNKAKEVLSYVRNNITYLSDMTQFKDNEVWLFPFETLSLKKGDCEDGAILIANMLIRAGIPYWRIRLNAGDVKGGGHCWVTYLREIDNQWVILDWCYWPDDAKNLNLLYSKAENYYDIWFSWNSKYIYLDEKYDRT